MKCNKMRNVSNSMNVLSMGMYACGKEQYWEAFQASQSWIITGEWQKLSNPNRERHLEIRSVTYLGDTYMVYVCYHNARVMLPRDEVEMVMIPLEKSWQRSKKSVQGDLKSSLKSWKSFPTFTKIVGTQEPNEYMFVICEYCFEGTVLTICHKGLEQGESLLLPSRIGMFY